MIEAIMKIHTTSSSVTFVCGDVAIIGNGEFRASSGKVDGFILYADTLRYENGAKLSRDEQENLKCLYQHFVLNHEDFICRYNREERQKDSRIHSTPIGRRPGGRADDDGKLLKSPFTGGK